MSIGRGEQVGVVTFWMSGQVGVVSFGMCGQAGGSRWVWSVLGCADRQEETGGRGQFFVAMARHGQSFCRSKQQCSVSAGGKWAW